MLQCAIDKASSTCNSSETRTKVSGKQKGYRAVIRKTCEEHLVMRLTITVTTLGKIRISDDAENVKTFADWHEFFSFAGLFDFAPWSVRHWSYYMPDYPNRNMY
jgi:hypothetical protein